MRTDETWTGVNQSERQKHREKMDEGGSSDKNIEEFVAQLL